MAKSAGIKRFAGIALGAFLTSLCGLFLLNTPFGEPWVRSSYDYLFRFGSRSVTNKVVLIAMDSQAYADYDQTRDVPWDRGLHAALLNKLADDGCRLVVVDALFRKPGDATKDEALSAAIARQSHIVLMAELAQVTHPDLAGAQPILPAASFLAAANTNWGLGNWDYDMDGIVRRHWPFPAPDIYPSLPWTAARLAGTELPAKPHQQWLRYYGANGTWTRLSYRFAMAEPTNYFHDCVVFIGNQPRTAVPDGEADKFSVPYTRWTGESVGGVDVMITAFLNLVNHEWLERLPTWAEMLVLVVSGGVLGVLLGLLRWREACVTAIAAALLVSLMAILLSYYMNGWFPWLVVSGGQVPCALGCAFIIPKLLTRRATPVGRNVPVVGAGQKGRKSNEIELATGRPETPDYELFDPPFGKGAYGKVWLARNAIGQWQALKVVYLTNFNGNAHPYEREFNGIKRYKPISDKHPGLLRVDFVSRKRDDYFYYVMELGDAAQEGWQENPVKYKPRSLLGDERNKPGGRLAPVKCMRVGLELAGALDFLHQQGLTHRDIKPQNIIFVNGHPKLADVGLTAEIVAPDKQGTLVGTPGYMPPSPESPGTPQADVYALGMVLYVLATGRKSAQFPEISSTLVESPNSPQFLSLNSIILRACQPDRSARYQTAAELHEALRKALETP